MPDVSVTPLGHDLYLIDAFMHGAPENLACYLFDTPQRVLIECGPSRTIDHLFAALDYLGIDDAGTLAVTHIHLDHAGGAGHFALHGVDELGHGVLRRQAAALRVAGPRKGVWNGEIIAGTPCSIEAGAAKPLGRFGHPGVRQRAPGKRLGPHGADRPRPPPGAR